MRALTFASLITDGGGEAENVMRELSFVESADAQVIKDAKRMLKSQYSGAPKVLDMFGGGGTIPYEAALLGAEVWSIDYNPLSVFIQKANLEFSQDALSELKLPEVARVVQESGMRVLKTLEEKTKDLFPLRESLSEHSKGVFAYFWSYRRKCRECGYDFLLMKRPWLSRKSGKHTALRILDGVRGQSVSLEECKDGHETESNAAWPGRNGTAYCPKCRTEHKNPSIQECSDSVVAIGELLKKGKVFKAPPRNVMPSEEYLVKREKHLLKSRGLCLPESRLPKWSGIVNAALYGMETHSDFLNRRQRLVLLELIGTLLDEWVLLQKEQSVVMARYVISTLSALIDQIVDWNCRLSMWISQNEQVGRAFCGPGVPMLWDYVETDPLLSGPANLWGKLERIVAGVWATPYFDKRPTVCQGQAQCLPFTGGKFDAVITDPPYYDNLYYNVLADFFYAWKRPLLERLCPELFVDGQCGQDEELVSSHFRHGINSHQWYCAQLTQCLKEVARVLKDDGMLSFVFAHSSLAGWDAIVQSFRHSGMVLTSAEPLSIERRQRPRAMTSEAVNTCIVLVGRKSSEQGSSIDIGIVEQYVSAYAGTMAKSLEECGWHGRDIGMAIFAKGVVTIANASCVTGVTSDVEALQRVGELVNSLVPAFKLQIRQSL